MDEPAKVTVALTVRGVCLSGEEECEVPKCPTCCFTHEEMTILVDEPSVRICGCGWAWIVRTCETCEDIADRRKRGIGPDCYSCLGTGHGRTSDHDCPRCNGRGYDLTDRRSDR
jgi:hypothetical protein